MSSEGKDNEFLEADELNLYIQQFNVQTVNFVKSFGKKGTGQWEFQNPTGACVTGKGHVVVVDSTNGRIQLFTNDGKPLFKFGDSGPGKLCKPLGYIYHKSMFIYCVWQLKPMLEIFWQFRDVFVQNWRKRRGWRKVVLSLGFACREMWRSSKSPCMWQEQWTHSTVWSGRLFYWKWRL